MLQEKARRKKFKFRFNGVYFTIGLIIFVQSISLILPFIWMLLTSFKGLIDFNDNFIGLPKKWHFENYVNVFKLMNIEATRNGKLYSFSVVDMFVNSLVLSVFKSFFGLLPMVLLVYVVAKYDFIGKKFLFNLNVFVMIIPIVGSLANTLIIYRQFHIYNNLWTYIIFPGHPFGFNFLLLYGVFKAIPNAYSEAARIDGASHFRVFLRIMLPMVIPTLVTLYVLSFIGHWNNYSETLVYLPSTPTLAYGMYDFQYNSAKYGAILPEILAGFVVCSVPSVAMFIGFQGVITKSLAVGGLKG